MQGGNRIAWAQFRGWRASWDVPKGVHIKHACATNLRSQPPRLPRLRLQVRQVRRENLRTHSCMTFKVVLIVFSVYSGKTCLTDEQIDKLLAITLRTVSPPAVPLHCHPVLSLCCSPRCQPRYVSVAGAPHHRPPLHRPREMRVLLCRTSPAYVVAYRMSWCVIATSFARSSARGPHVFCVELAGRYGVQFGQGWICGLLNLHIFNRVRCHSHNWNLSVPFLIA